MSRSLSYLTRNLFQDRDTHNKPISKAHSGQTERGSRSAELPQSNNSYWIIAPSSDIHWDLQSLQETNSKPLHYQKESEAASSRSHDKKGGYLPSWMGPPRSVPIPSVYYLKKSVKQVCSISWYDRGQSGFAIATKKKKKKSGFWTFYPCWWRNLFQFLLF